MVCRVHVRRGGEGICICAPAPHVCSRDVSDKKINKFLGCTNLSITYITSMMMYLLVISLLSVVSSGAEPKSYSLLNPASTWLTLDS